MIIQDAVAILLVVAATTSVAHAAYRYSASTCGPKSVVLVSTWILTWSWISFVGQLLGWMDLLTPVNYVGAVLGSGLLFRWCANETVCDRKRSPGTACLATRDRFWAMFWLAVAIGFSFRTLYVTLTRHPTQWDSIAYHLPRVGQWSAEHGLNGQANLKWFYPGTNELLQYWFSGALSGDFTYAFNNVASVLFLGIATFGLSRQLGASILFSHVIAAGVTVNYITVHQALDNKNDVPIAALLVSTLFLFASQDRTKTSSYFPIGLALGLTLGIKYYAAAVALGTAATVIGSILVLRTSAGKKTACIAVFVVALLSVGGGWYLRNWIATGEPMFPKAIFGSDSSTSNDTLLATSLIGSLNLEVLLAWINQAYQKLGVIPFLGLLAAPSAVVHAALRLAKRDRRLDATTVLFVACLLLCFTLYLITPFTISSPSKKYAYLSFGYLTIRLGVPFFVLLTIYSWCQISESVSSWRKRFDVPKLRNSRRGQWLDWTMWTAVVVLLAMQLSQCSKIYRPGFEIDLVLDRYHFATLAVSFTLAWLIVSRVGTIARAWSRRRVASFGIVGTGGLLLLVGIGSARWHSQFSAQYDTYFKTGVFNWMDRTAGREGFDRLLVIGHRTYPFAGSRRQRMLHQVADMPVYKVPLNNPEELERLLFEGAFSILVAERHNGLWNRIAFEEHAKTRKSVYDALYQDDRYAVYHVDFKRLAH